MSDNDARDARIEAAKERPRRKMGFVFKLLGLLIVALAAWIGWYAYREGKMPDLTSEEQHKRMLAQASQDFQHAEKKAVDVSNKVVSWAEHSIDELRTRIKGKPPETKEEISDLIKESKQEVEKDTRPSSPQPPPTQEPSKPVSAPKSKGDLLVEEAREQYRKGLAVYALTDPGSSQQQVQDNLRIAAPCFSYALDLLEQARALGSGGAAMDVLEQSSARRLYDCRKRMELRR